MSDIFDSPEVVSYFMRDMAENAGMDIKEYCYLSLEEKASLLGCSSRELLRRLDNLPLTDRQHYYLSKLMRGPEQ